MASAQQPVGRRAGRPGHPARPQDPIKARRLAFNGGAGIHGTDDVASIGDPTSHGCIRMLIPDVNSLFDRVPVGSPVYVANALAPRRRHASDQSAKSARLTQPV